VITIEEDNAPDTYIKESSIGGFGLFAAKNFSKDDVIVNYNNFVKNFYKLKWTKLKPEQYNKNWLIPLDEDFCFTNDKSCKFHYLNHSRTPNCDWYILKLLVIATKDIKKIEELFIDYRVEYRPNRVRYPEWI
jgi:SET domain-containing protein